MRATITFTALEAELPAGVQVGDKLTERARHIWERHRLLPGEVREAVETGTVYKGPRSRQGGRTYIVRGRSDAGRPLWILLRPAEKGVAILITAREDR